MFAHFLFKNRFKGDFLRSGGIGAGLDVLGGEKLVFMAFFGMNGGEEELKDTVMMPRSVPPFALGTANDPVAAFFGFLEGVDAGG